MGTKQHPTPHDAYDKALQDEPMFVLLARDPHAPRAVRQWLVDTMRIDHDNGVNNVVKYREADACQRAMQAWRDNPDNMERVALSKQNGPVATYYTEGKNADWFEQLDNAEFIEAIAKAAMDIADGDFEHIEKYMPVVAMLSLAANRLAQYVTEPKET